MEWHRKDVSHVRKGVRLTHTYNIVLDENVLNAMHHAVYVRTLFELSAAGALIGGCASELLNFSLRGKM